MSAKTLENWSLLEHIGKGGSGDVYLARHKEFDQLAAVKILRSGIETEEQRILAELRHPNIAQLYAAGVTGDGNPYIVMEYVKGKRIDEYANERALSVAERLALFAKVCDAVEYAHRNLVMHLDIKPANIIVNADGEPKLLDFGIARRVGSSRPVVDQDVFTLPYASPEQLTPGAMLTTRSDVYSLGALLYHLLAGRPPLTPESDEPLPPSRAVLESRTVRSPKGQTLVLPAEKNAAFRSASVRELERTLRGSLDNIALMALRKEENRRYTSVDEFRRDIGRYLAGRPVHARSDTLAYSAIRTARRYPLWLVAAVLALTTLSANWFLPWALREQGASAASHAAALEKKIRPVREAIGRLRSQLTDDRVRAEVEQLEAALDVGP